MKDLIIIGAGDLGKDVAWLVERINERNPEWNLLGFTEKSELKQFQGYPVLGTDDVIEEELTQTKNRINKNIKDSDINRIIFKKYDIIDAHIKRGYCHLVLLDYVSAIQDFEEAIKLDPTYTTAYFNMGICLYNLNKKKEAI